MVKHQRDDSRAEGSYGATVALSEVLASDLRLDAAAFSIEAREARTELGRGPYPLRPLLASAAETDSLASNAHNAFRFSRIYVERAFGVPFLSSSDIISLNPEQDTFVSRTQTKRLDVLMARPWDVLISCSGTVGNVALAPPSWKEFALSQDVIRLRAADADTAGYLACFLRSRWGRAQLVGQSYGSVITHIEPHHLTKVLAPKPPPILMIGIGKAFVEASTERDRANQLFAEAERELLNRLKLPALRAQVAGPVLGQVKRSDLKGRFDATFHDPSARALDAALRKLPVTVHRLGHPELGLRVHQVTKFRKRVYVERGGIPMLSSKQLFQVDPIDVKNLARGAHLDDLPEIELAANMLCVTRSGTVGRVLLVPPYMNGWTASEHALRIISENPENAAYLYAWLASPFGRLLFWRLSSGSVIVHIDRFQLVDLPIPWLPEADRKVVSDLAQRANELRSSAWSRERAALKRFAGLIGLAQ